ncbi:MAG: hypothetical protein UT36_C0013G0008 [Candidatus Peregrinibacteria bacterium GW2011_GWF2_39_17]|nr:MAG: hypothetical protein UT36_C0013G0008 [Candidatus Peregrinibacteria bacterium GW2011_GWF2_39_17]
MKSQANFESQAISNSESQSQPQPSSEFNNKINDDPFSMAAEFNPNSSVTPEYHLEPESKFPEKDLTSTISHEPTPDFSVEEPLEGELMEPPSPQSPKDDQIKVESGIEDLSLSGGIIQKVRQLLQEANLTTRHLKFCCGGVVVVILVIIIGMVMIPWVLRQGTSFLKGNSNHVEQEQEQEQEVSAPSTENPDDNNEPDLLPPNSGPVWVDPSVYSGLLLGELAQTKSLVVTGLEIGLQLGMENILVDFSTKFQQFVTEQELIYNFYYTDLNELLNASGDRVATLDDYYNQFKDTYNSGVAHYKEVQDIRAIFLAQFKENEPIKVTRQAEFFALVKDFDGDNAEQALLRFIDISQAQVAIKAKYLAFGKVEERYKSFLEKSAQRLKDIDLNREALIAGVQVVDIYGSDLDLILTEEQLTNPDLTQE